MNLRNIIVTRPETPLQRSNRIRLLFMEVQIARRVLFTDPTTNPQAMLTATQKDKHVTMNGSNYLKYFSRNNDKDKENVQMILSGDRGKGKEAFDYGNEKKKEKIRRLACDQLTENCFEWATKDSLRMNLMENLSKDYEQVVIEKEKMEKELNQSRRNFHFLQKNFEKQKELLVNVVKTHQLPSKAVKMNMTYIPGRRRRIQGRRKKMRSKQEELEKFKTKHKPSFVGRIGKKRKRTHGKGKPKGKKNIRFRKKRKLNNVGDRKVFSK